VILTLAALAAAVPSAASPDETLDLGRWTSAFTRVCADLSSARAELQQGTRSEDAFADRVLELFARADSLRDALEVTPPAREPGQTQALDRGVRYLIVSLRENYLGIVERDGLRFVSADQAFRAAVGWRNQIATAEAFPEP
jgi:hypothetical protein